MLYSKRLKAQSGAPEAYQYDLPQPLKVQIVRIVDDFFCFLETLPHHYYHYIPGIQEAMWIRITNEHAQSSLTHNLNEVGAVALRAKHKTQKGNEVYAYFLNDISTEKALYCFHLAFSDIVDPIEVA